MEAATKPDIDAFLRARIADDKADALAEIAAGYNGYADPGWDSDRVLAECEAKLQIVELHRLYDGETYRETLCCARCTATGEYPADDAYTDEQNWPCPTLRALASLYADHSDYDESWRP